MAQISYEGAVLNTKFIFVAVFFVLSHVQACSNDAKNELPSSANDDAINARIDQLEKQSLIDQENSEQTEQGMRLNERTLNDTNDYLSKLHRNINDTRPQDLPEWQYMYEALVDDRAIYDNTFGLGPRSLHTNFYKLNEQLEEHRSTLGQHDQRHQNTENANQVQDTKLQLILERLATIDANINDLNKTLSAKIATIDKTLSDYNGRIIGVENRMKTVEIDLNSFRSEFVEYRQRVTNIEDLLRRYDLARMHQDIRNLSSQLENHDERIIALEGQVLNHSSELSVLNTSLSETEQELSAVSAQVGTNRVAIEEIWEIINE